VEGQFGNDLVGQFYSQEDLRGDKNLAERTPHDTWGWNKVREGPNTGGGGLTIALENKRSGMWALKGPASMGLTCSWGSQRSELRWKNHGERQGG
jgi:hypothetical protein